MFLECCSVLSTTLAWKQIQSENIYCFHLLSSLPAKEALLYQKPYCFVCMKPGRIVRSQRERGLDGGGESILTEKQHSLLAYKKFPSKQKTKQNNTYRKPKNK